MISDAILELVYKIFMFAVHGKDPLRFNINSSVYEYVHDFVAFIFFILPIHGLRPIFTIIVAIIGFRIIVAVIKTFWDLLPIL